MPTTAKTTKTKTKPAKKPAVKPAGASVKPKQTKTIKTSSAKPTKKSTVNKPTTTSSSSKTTKGKTDNRKCEVFFGIIMIIAAVAIVGGAICYALFGGKDDTIMVETSQGNQVATTMTELANTNISILIPKDFAPLTDSELQDFDNVIDSSDADVKTVYTNQDQTAVIYLTELNQPTDNSKIKESIDEIAKVLKTAGVTNVQTDLKDIQGHNVGILKFSGTNSANFPHQHTAFFSDGDKTYNVAFLCEQSLVDEWDKVGDAIINSITFRE